MKWPIIVLAAVSLAYGYQYDGLRVRVGWSDALADKEYFFKIPRTIREVEAKRWQRTQRPLGPLQELRMYCAPGRVICPMYDTTGFIAGLQIALPVDEYESLAIKPEKNFILWSAPASATEPARDYWAITQYFVSEESLNSGAGPTIENGATLQDGGVWVLGPEKHLIRIPATEAELNTTKFKKQNCIPNMGTHYYYNFGPDMKCEDLFPWFPLTNQAQLVGVGFMVFGKVANKDLLNWLEVAPATSGKTAVEITMPDAPSCILDWASTYGMMTLHIYYIDQPWTIRCNTGDSVKPAAVLDRLALTGYMYANKVADVFKDIFG